MQKEEAKFKKVSGQVFDPFSESKYKNNVLNNVNIADEVASASKTENKSFTALAKQSSLYSANNRSDKEIKHSLRNLS